MIPILSVDDNKIQTCVYLTHWKHNSSLLLAIVRGFSLHNTYFFEKLEKEHLGLDVYFYCFNNRAFKG